MGLEISENALNVLAAMTHRGIGRSWVVKKIRGNETSAAMVALLNLAVKCDGTVTEATFSAAKSKVESAVHEQSAFADGIVALGDKHFPSHRGNVKGGDQPVAVFYRGDLGLLGEENHNIAVIGLLMPDDEIRASEGELVDELAKRGATIVSGLALGCDTIAHERALAAGAKTVAILPSPLSQILPASNKGLAADVVGSGGLLVSEYYCNANSGGELSSRYVERDRLQALYSDCVVLAASYAQNDQGLDSGARHAMRYAEEYSIGRAVMYDPERNRANPMFDLNRQLLAGSREIIAINSANLQQAAERVMALKAPRVSKDKQASLFA